VKSTHDKILDTTKNNGKTLSTISMKTNGEDLTLNKTFSASSTNSTNNTENIKSKSTSNIPNLPNLETSQISQIRQVTTLNKEESKLKQEDTNPNQNKNTINDDDTNTQIVNRLEELYKKYKNIFEADDASDFETILDALKSNLSD
jgi:hypothetical protein